MCPFLYRSRSFRNRRFIGAKMEALLTVTWWLGCYCLLPKEPCSCCVTVRVSNLKRQVESLAYLPEGPWGSRTNCPPGPADVGGDCRCDAACCMGGIPPGIPAAACCIPWSIMLIVGFCTEEEGEKGSKVQNNSPCGRPENMALPRGAFAAAAAVAVAVVAAASVG